MLPWFPKKLRITAFSQHCRHLISTSIISSIHFDLVLFLLLFFWLCLHLSYYYSYVFFFPLGRNKSSDRVKEKESWIRITHTQVLEKVQDRGSRFLGFSFVAHSAGENKSWVLVDLHRVLRVKLTEIRQKVCRIQPTKYTGGISLSTKVKGLSSQPHTPQRT